MVNPRFSRSYFFGFSKSHYGIPTCGETPTLPTSLPPNIKFRSSDICRTISPFLAFVKAASHKKSKNSLKFSQFCLINASSPTEPRATKASMDSRSPPGASSRDRHRLIYASAIIHGMLCWQVAMSVLDQGRRALIMNPD